MRTLTRTISTVTAATTVLTTATEKINVIAKASTLRVALRGHNYNSNGNSNNSGNHAKESDKDNHTPMATLPKPWQW